MIIALNSLQKFGNQKLTGPILPNFAHRCAVLNWQSYDTSASILFEFKRDFKSFKRVWISILSSTVHLSKCTMRKLNKIKTFDFTIIAFFVCVKGQFNNYLNNKFFGSHSLRSNQSMERLISVMNKRVSSTRSLLSIEFFNSVLDY